MRLAGKLKPGVTQKHVRGNSTDAPLEELHLFLASVLLCLVFSGKSSAANCFGLY